MPKTSEILNVAQIILKPTAPAKGPPLPDSWDVSWPGFFTRGIKRLTTQGISGPGKTIKEKGLIEEIKQEFAILTGKRL